MTPCRQSVLMGNIMSRDNFFCRPSSRVAAVSPSATKLMAQRAAAYDDCVSLGQGVPGFDPPDTVIEAVKETISTNRLSTRYSLQNGYPPLRDAVSKMMATEKGVLIDPEKELCITVGGMEALLAAILTVADRNDEILLPSPTYASYTEQVLLAGAVPVFVQLDGQWRLDITAMEKALTPRSKAILLCNPGNPTGNVFSSGEIRSLCELALANDLVLIVDEAYDYIVYSSEKILNPLSIDRYRNHVISIGSLSKKYCLTGWRVGWVAAASQWMDHIVKVHDAATICAPTPSQFAALAALGLDDDWVKDCCKQLEHRRAVCCDRLDRLGDYFSYVPPKGAFYILARYLFSEESSENMANRLLDEAHVITVPGGSFGPGGEGHLRLSFGGDEDEINEAFDRIERWIQQGK